ncbi:NUDIX hydrolase [Ochrovirga pacifica]|uniref:NUDIX hydrolase n=1 Tax=Ochrovirga pacifica TaxID=1042376 RepID=UPI0002558375|nr:CoA pyrophosphatase [Ochrovirga pacifica]
MTNFEQLVSKIELLKNSPLLGIKAHQKLAPLQRPLFTAYNTPKNAKLAGVLILLYPNAFGQTQILLTQRAKYQGTHSQQISFPGGKKDSNDKNLQETALRETFEEVGIAAKNLELIKPMSTLYIPPSNFNVHPYIALAHKTPNFVTNYEVAKIVEFPMSKLLSETTLDTFKMKSHSLQQNTVPCFKYQEHIIWGATAMMLSELKEILKSLS